MPFFVHPREVSFDSLSAYSARRLAAIHPMREFANKLDALADFNKKTEKITYCPSPEESANWKKREEDRFYSGDYVRVPWFTNDRYPHHFVHMSRKKPGLLAYTKDEEHGHLDIQTPIRPGKYLEEHYVRTGYIPPSTMRDWVAKCTAEYMSLKFATTAEEIIKLYRGGPNSCMSKSADNYRSHIHPVAVYGDSDLAFAYYGNLENASARAVVWPDEKIYGRIYGASDVLSQLLQQHGYNHGDFAGARIRKIRAEGAHNAWVMPYLDIGSWVGVKDNDPKHFYIMHGEQVDIDVQTTDGVASEDDRPICDNCSERYYEDDGRTTPDGVLCEACFRSSYTHCRDCQDVVHRDDICTSEIGYEYCESCYDELDTCVRDTCGERFSEREFSYSVKATREKDKATHLCNSCARTYSYCEEHEEVYERSKSDGCYICDEVREEQDNQLELVLSTAAEWEGLTYGQA